MEFILSVVERARHVFTFLFWILFFWLFEFVSDLGFRVSSLVAAFRPRREICGLETLLLKTAACLLKAFGLPAGPDARS
jgi:hypothetical protein